MTKHADHKMPLAERFAAYNRLRKRQGKDSVTLAEYEAQHYGKNGVPKRKMPEGTGCRFPLWQDKPNGQYCDRKKVDGSSYCAEHERLTRQPGTSLQDYHDKLVARKADRRKAKIFGIAA